MSGGGRRARWRLGVAVVAALAMGGLGACGDNPFEIQWQASPDTVLLFSLARPELDLPSGFGFNQRQLVRIQQPTATGAWDMVLDTQDDQLVFLPPGALGVTSRARIAELENRSFEEVEEAPSDTARYVADTPLTAELGNVYVVRTNQAVDAFGRRCVFFAKFEVLDMDVESGTLMFVFDSNPVCNDLRLVPPDSD